MYILSSAPPSFRSSLRLSTTLWPVLPSKLYTGQAVVLPFLPFPSHLLLASPRRHVRSHSRGSPRSSHPLSHSQQIPTVSGREARLWAPGSLPVPAKWEILSIKIWLSKLDSSPTKWGWKVISGERSGRRPRSSIFEANKESRHHNPLHRGTVGDRQRIGSRENQDDTNSAPKDLGRQYPGGLVHNRWSCKSTELVQ